MATRVILLVTLVTSLLLEGVRADDVLKLTGSALKIKDAVSKSDADFIGAITELGQEIDQGADHPYAGPIYEGVKVRVIQQMKGTLPSQILINFEVIFVPSHNEKIPKVGIRYIFFVTKGSHGLSDLFTILKLLPATEDNIAEVEKLILN